MICICVEFVFVSDLFMICICVEFVFVSAMESGFWRDFGRNGGILGEIEKGGSNLSVVNASHGVIWGKWRKEEEEEDPRRQD